MKIRLAILDSDSIYAARIAKVFEAKYADVLEVYSFTVEELAKEQVKNRKIDIFLASDSFEIDPRQIPSHCGFAYLVESPDISSVRDQKVVCKFQRAEIIYKQILSLYAETTEGIVQGNIGGGNAKIVAFASPCGGVGTSCVAVASAMRYAAQQKKVLYLNLEKFGSSDLYFAGEGISDMSDVIYALKSKRSNLAMKLESCVKRGNDGVFFYGGAKLALDMLELTSGDIVTLLKQLKIVGAYDYIFVDMEFALEKAKLEIYNLCDGIIWVSDGSERANLKIVRAFQALTVIEQREGIVLSSRTRLVYNRFSSKTGAEISIDGMKVLGGAPVYVHANTRQVVEQLSTIGMFDNLI